MEPPAKRRRTGGQSHFDHHDDPDDDELSYQPHEVLARRDPGYKLNLERAHADQRFQATMAHIFEKYGRDFEGIGDEIDMVTGEIVVNNGHLHNMRDEGDVGEISYFGVEDDGDDEGMLLEDLIDDGDIDDGRDEDNFPQGFIDNDAGAEGMFGDNIDSNDDEDRILQGRVPSLHSTSLVPGSRALATSRLSSLLSGLPNNDRMGFEAPSFTFDASPFSFGASPLASGPWELPHVPLQASLAPSNAIGPYRHKVKRLPPRDKYNFPVQDGRTSIWAAGSKYKDDEDINPAGSKASAKAQRPMLPAAPEKPQLHDDVDEDEYEEEILTGKSSKSKQVGSSIVRPNVEDSEEHVLAGPSPPVNTSKNRDGTSPQPKASAVIPVKKRKRRRQEDLLTSMALTLKSNLTWNRPGNNSNLTTMDEENGERRRSGRARKQVEFLGKVSWKEALGHAKPQPQPLELQPESKTWDVPEDDTSSGDDDTHSIRPVADVPPDSLDIERETRIISNSVTTRSIPDSQDTVPSSTDMSNIPKATEDVAAHHISFKNNNVDSACVLSDDEAPIWPSKPDASHDDASLPQPHAEPNTAAAVVDFVQALKDDSGTMFQIAETPDISENPKNLRRRGMPEANSTKKTTAKQTQTSKRATEPAPPPAPVVDEHSLESVPESASGSRARRSTRESKKLQRYDSSSPKVVPNSQSSLDQSQQMEFEALLDDEAPAESIDKNTDSSFGEQEIRYIETTPRLETKVYVNDTSEYATTPKAPSTKPKARPSQPENQTPRHSPSKPTARRQIATPSNSSKPQTPRHAIINSHTKVPSSRRSILSLVSDAEDDNDDMDELISSRSSLVNVFSSGTAARRIWKSSALTTEIYRTPVKKRPSDPRSPGSMVKTPGGTLRVCGLDGYRCGRDFCFTCL